MSLRLIREGQSSQEVADVQARLRALGYDIADDSGHFGPATSSAVRTFQQRRGLLADALVGHDTWAELVEASWRLGDRSLYLRQPLMRGDDVALLQGRLSALGFDSGREDGIFGVNTARAVLAFQKEYGVAEDGIFGVRSHAALTGLRVDRPGTAAALREELRRRETIGLNGRVVAIDPGHGGDDPGDVGSRGHDEAAICWDLAARLAQHLVEAGARVRFTRTESENPDTSERARRANEVNADVMLSLHFNSHHEPTAAGACTYFFKGSSAGEDLAENVLTSLVALGARDCRTHATSYRILRETRMPALLIEPAFITNPAEEKELQDPERRAAIAAAIASALTRYFGPA